MLTARLEYSITLINSYRQNKQIQTLSLKRFYCGYRKRIFTIVNKFRTHQNTSVSKKEMPTLDAPTTTILALTVILDSNVSFLFVWFKA